MLKKTITFDDLDGNPVTEDFYFNLNKAEIAELELSQKGGLSEYLRAIVQDENGKEIMSAFKEVITMSVGQRSEDGRRFVKSKEITDNFVQTEAYSELFMELVTDAEKSAEFIRGIVPASLADKIDEAQLPKATDESAVSNEMLKAKDPKDMTKEELIEAMKAKNEARSA